MLNGALTWSSNDFFLSKLPNMARLVDKSPEQNNLSTRQAYFQLKGQNLSKFDFICV